MSRGLGDVYKRQAYNRAACAKKELATYPKFVHERINDFEDRLLAFMHFGER